MFKTLKITKEYVKTEQSKIYILYKKDNICLYIVRKRISNRTIFHLKESGDIILEQLYPFGGITKPSKEKALL